MQTTRPRGCAKPRRVRLWRPNVREGRVSHNRRPDLLVGLGAWGRLDTGADTSPRAQTMIRYKCKRNWQEAPSPGRGREAPQSTKRTEKSPQARPGEPGGRRRLRNTRAGRALESWTPESSIWPHARQKQREDPDPRVPARGERRPKLQSTPEGSPQSEFRRTRRRHRPGGGGKRSSLLRSSCERG